MEPKHKELLKVHRNKFIETIDVERIFPFLQESEVLTQLDISQISTEVTPTARVEKLLDLLLVKDKGTQAFQKLCVALETTYPHLLTIMFLGGNQKVTGKFVVYVGLSMSADQSKQCTAVSRQTTSHSKTLSQLVDTISRPTERS